MAVTHSDSDPTAEGVQLALLRNELAGLVPGHASGAPSARRDGRRVLRRGLGGQQCLGAARTAIDADLVAVLKREHVDGFVGRLAADYDISEPMIRDAIQRESGFNLIHLATMFKVEIGPGGLRASMARRSRCAASATRPARSRVSAEVGPGTEGARPVGTRPGGGRNGLRPMHGPAAQAAFTAAPRPVAASCRRAFLADGPPVRGRACCGPAWRRRRGVLPPRPARRTAACGDSRPRGS
jgi:hypothetical protein